MIRLLIHIFVLFLISSLVACSGSVRPEPPLQPDATALTQSSGDAADVLHILISERMNKKSPILVATMVQADKLDKTSSLGRLVMQQVGSRLNQYGYHVVEAKMAEGLVMVPNSGEFMLTRESTQLLHKNYPNAQAALVGSYTVNPKTVYFSLRIVRLDDGVVVAAHEYFLNNDGEVRRMIPDPGFSVIKQYPSRPVRVTSQ